jgi:hypothetical protein
LLYLCVSRKRFCPRAPPKQSTGASSDYIDVTRPSALEPNRLTNVRAQEFGDNLQAQGFKKSVQGDLTVYTKGGTEYDVYPQANSLKTW